MIRVIHLGLGEIGKGTIRTLLKQPKHLKLAAAVDPAFAGKDLRDIMPNDAVPRMRIFATLEEALAKGKYDVCTLTTGSRTVQVRETLEQLIGARVHVVSTCEELAFPNLRSHKLAAQLDAKARKAGVVILGTGVNPGFAMDSFALACTAPCATVDSISIVRTLDAAKRRQQLQKKVGAGMTLAEVKGLIKKNAIGHVGLGESCAMIAAGLGWKLSAIKERFEPVIASQPVASDYYTLKAGDVCGMRSIAVGLVAGKKMIELDLTMAIGVETYDEIFIQGDPSLRIRTATGFPGDSSTVGILVNAARCVATLSPGVRLMSDLLRIRSIGR